VTNINDPGKSAEYLFASKCLQYGYMVCWPSSEKIPYDMAVHNGHSFLRVQVKSTFVKNSTGDSYQVNCRKGGSNGEPYKKGDCDLIACYVSLTDTWYILPIDVAAGKAALYFYPHRDGEKIGKYEHFRESWELLKESRP